MDFIPKDFIHTAIKTNRVFDVIYLFTFFLTHFENFYWNTVLTAVLPDLLIFTRVISEVGTESSVPLVIFKPQKQFWNFLYSFNTRHSYVNTHMQASPVKVVFTPVEVTWRMRNISPRQVGRQFLKNLLVAWAHVSPWRRKWRNAVLQL